MTVRIKANKSSEFRSNMGCRHCNTDEIEFQEHLEVCTGTKDLRVNLKMNVPNKHSIFWRRMSKRLKDLKKSGETEEMKEKMATEEKV